MRRAAKVDANQGAIVAALRAVGARVHVASQYGGGFPDLVVTFQGRVHLVEVKDGSKPPSARRLTPAELEFAREHPVAVVTSRKEALGVIGVETDDD